MGITRDRGFYADHVVDGHEQKPVSWTSAEHDSFDALTEGAPMVTARILFAMTALVASPIPTKAQWSIENHFGNPRVTATGPTG